MGFTYYFFVEDFSGKLHIEYLSSGTVDLRPFDKRRAGQFERRVRRLFREVTAEAAGGIIIIIICVICIPPTVEIYYKEHTQYCIYIYMCVYLALAFACLFVLAPLMSSRVAGSAVGRTSTGDDPQVSLLSILYIYIYIYIYPRSSCYLWTGSCSHHITPFSDILERPCPHSLI